mgnify:CR=1 FL=1
MVLTTNLHCLKGTCCDGDGRELQEMTQVVVSQSHLLASRRENFDVGDDDGNGDNDTKVYQWLITCYK